MVPEDPGAEDSGMLLRIVVARSLVYLGETLLKIAVHVAGRGGFEVFIEVR